MPELPEVETVCRGLAPVLEGRRLLRVEPRRPDLRVPFPADLSERLTGGRVAAVRRRSKYALIEMADEGRAAGAVVILHLGMSGRVLVAPVANAPPPGKHDHLIVETDAGMRLVLNDPRRFGMVLMAERAGLQTHPLIAHLGPEPLGNDFSAAYLLETLLGRRTSLKAALMDQRVVAGLGNIYVCESLYRARLSPRRSGLSMGPRRSERLAAAIREVLREAIAAGGSSLRDYVQLSGELGYFQARFQVYGRAGEPCARETCAGTVARIVQTGRSTFFCPACQR